MKNTYKIIYLGFRYESEEWPKKEKLVADVIIVKKEESERGERKEGRERKKR